MSESVSMSEWEIGDALPAAFDEILMKLHGQGHVQIGVHKISRDRFDLIPGDEQHFEATNDRGEFWTKNGLSWSNEGMRHMVNVNYFTSEAPVVVPLHSVRVPA